MEIYKYEQPKLETKTTKMQESKHLSLSSSTTNEK